MHGTRYWPQGQLRYFESGGCEQQKIFDPTLSLSCGVQKKKQRNESTMKVLVLLLSIAGAVFYKFI